MQAHEVLRQIPVIMVTARIDRESIVHGLELGAADYVVKPFHNRELLARIQSVLRWKSF
jgi:DNA-binding response OmpR family regulator